MVWCDKARVIGAKIKQMFESGQSCHAGRPWRPGRLWIGVYHLLDYFAISNWFEVFSGNIKFPDTGPQHLHTH
jgi:hypothetical protein